MCVFIKLHVEMYVFKYGAKTQQQLFKTNLFMLHMCFKLINK